ncbi:kinase-like domain-containing protein [Mycena capillaripes]|nr:kinase-like domain-containing protein [Mycena capillaripes]
MASLDPVWSLVNSAQFRVKLLKISEVLGVSNERRLRDALQKDEAEIARLFKLVASTDIHKKAILRLKGGSAQHCVDLIQNVLDKGSLQDPGFTLKARRLLVKLSEASDTLPSSLFIRGVSRLDKEATFGGTFGDIYRASYQGQDVALKRIRVFQRDASRHKIRQRFCREALLWQRLQNPYVLPFSGIDAESFPSFLCMVSPWMRHGTILKHLAENGNANVERRLFEIAQGLAYLHSQDIIHGDLRGSNILVDDEWHACLADFGLAVFSDATAATHTSHRGGSVRWMSPELHYPQSCGLETFRRTFASDVYSFAFVCVELYTGKPPFSDVSHDAAVMLRVMAKERPARPCDAEGRKLMSDTLWNLVQQCWSHEVAERPSMAHVVEMMQDANEDLRILSHITTLLPRLPRTPPGGKTSFQTHRSWRKRPPGPNTTTVYQSLSF